MKRLALLLIAAMGVPGLNLAAGVAEAAEDNDKTIAIPATPGNITVEPGNEVFLIGHAYGTQNYICLPTATGVAYSLFTPEATLFNERAKQLTTHFFSLNPEEPGVIRPTWQHSRDTSAVWAAMVPGGSSTDAAYVQAGAVPWLLLKKMGTQEGPGGGDTLTQTTFIQRIHTAGGVAPADGCTMATDIGRRAFVPYAADYYFYRKAGETDRD